MDMLKRSLAMLLVMAMLCSFVPFSVFAEDGEIPETTGATEAVEQYSDGSENSQGDGEAGNEDQTEATEETVPETTEETVPETTEETVPETTEETVPETTEETVPETTEETVPETTEETMPEIMEDMLLGRLATFGLARDNTQGNKPADGMTTGQPFPAGTGGSQLYRIPALVVLSDGTLVAAADARWNDSSDKGNIDTVVTYSKNMGASWNYTFANYIGDRGNAYDIQAATFIDPALAVKTVDGVETIYMVTDLYPGQATGSTMCIHAALYGTGMTDDGHLRVSDKNDNTLSDFYYYVGDYSDGFAPLCNSDGTATAYRVDEWFNVYKGETRLGNLFTYGDAHDAETGTTFYVYQTSYLVLTKSTDGGKTWSAPTMLNHQVKKFSEKFYGVGPASGLVTSTGRIMFAAYTFDNGDDGNTSVFYSDDNGATWQRSDSVREQTSEAGLTEADGTIYMFTRHGNYYYYSTDNGTTWSQAQSTNGISYLDSCEVSVMTYSEKIDGKTAILLSAPTASGRYAGQIFVGLVNADHSITWKYTYAVNGSDRYQYSSLKELNDGSLGLLYEDGDASITYTNIAIRDVVGQNAVIGTPDGNYTEEVVVELTIGQSQTYTDKTGNYEATATIENTAIAQMNVAGNTGAAETVVSTTKATEVEAGATYIIRLVNQDAALSSVIGSTDWGTSTLKFQENNFTANPEHMWTLEAVDGGYKVKNVNGYLNLGPAAAGKEGSNAAYLNATGEVFTIERSGNNWIFKNSYGQCINSLGGSLNAGGWKTGTALEMFKVITAADESTQITFTGVSEGETYAIVGSTKYIVRVLPVGVQRVENVELAVGQTKTYPDNTGNYEATYNPAGLNTNIATVTVDGTSQEGGSNIQEVTSISDGETYLICLPNGKFLKSNGNETENIAEAAEFVAEYEPMQELWTFECDNGLYLDCFEGIAKIGPSKFGQDVVGSKIQDQYRNDVVTVVKASVVEAIESTDITITGVSEGQTSVVVGTTKYNITVTVLRETLALSTGNPFTIIPAAAVTQAEIDAFNAAYGSFITAELRSNGNVALNPVAEGIVTDFLMGGTKYTIQVIGAPNPVTSANSPFVVGGNFIGSVTNDPRNEGMDYLTKLTMSSVMTKENFGSSSRGYQIDLSDTFANAENIAWDMVDESIAQVEVSEDGKTAYVTAVAPGTTYLSCSIDGEVYSIPVAIINTTATTTQSNWKYASLHVAEITRTDVWYSWNCSGDTDEFVQAVEGEAIWVVFDKNEKCCLNYYAKPDANNALTFMAATNSAGEYLTLADKTNPKNCDFYTKPGAGYNERTGIGFTNDQVAADIQAGLDLGCDGAHGFSRASGDDYPINTNLTYISDPMPTIVKTVDGILPTTRKRTDYRRYTEGMVAGVGELVYFKITVSLDRPTVWAKDANGNDTDVGAITYSNSIVSDTVLPGAYIYDVTKDTNLNGHIDTGEGSRVMQKNITELLNAPWTADEQTRTIDLYLVYEITKNDIPKFIIENTADLDWDYQSHYSTGALEADADAKASITVVGQAMDDIVIDFGQKVAYNGLTDIHLKYVNLGTFESKYGTYTITGENEATDDQGNPYYHNYTVTYTPTAILQEPDVIQMTGTYFDKEKQQQVTKVINGFVVYPATTVYYEEGFLTEDGSWDATAAQKATEYQTLELLGKSVFDTNGKLAEKESNQQHVYGYDPLYVSDGYTYGNSYASSNILGNKTSFTFTGKGFDLYANCTEETGYVAVLLRNSAGKNVKLFTVDTVVGIGSTPATTGQTGAEYHLPIVSWHGAHDTYTVTITKILETEPVKIDGVRIHNTVEDSSIFNIDLEDNPEFYQLRDYVLDAIGLNNYIIQDDGTIKKLAEQVFADVSTDSESPVALISSASEIYGDGATAQDLLDNGPKNELFLYKGQTLTFKVKTNREMQIGLKAPVAGTTYDLSYTVGEATTVKAKGAALNTSVDMFYMLANNAQSDTEYTVYIKNTGDNILSVTDLKICDDPNAAFVPLNVKDIENILVAAGYKDETEEPETPTEPEDSKEETRPSTGNNSSSGNGSSSGNSSSSNNNSSSGNSPSSNNNSSSNNNTSGNNNSSTNNKTTTTNKTTTNNKLTTVSKPETKEKTPKVTDVDAVLKITLVDSKGKELTAAELTASGAEGKKHGFASADIVKAVEDNMPVGYVLTEEKIQDAQVKYGEDAAISVEIGKAATLKVTYISIFGRKIDTATITKVQTKGTGTYGIIRAAQIRKAAPAGRFALSLFPAVVRYGTTSAITVPTF